MKDGLFKDLMQGGPAKVVNELVNDSGVDRLSVENVIEMLNADGLKFYSACQDIKTGDGDTPMTGTAVLTNLLGKSEDGLDGFEQVCQRLNIPTKNNSELGIFAGKMNLFFNTTAGTALVPEFVSRTMREAARESWDVRGLIAENVITPNGTYREWGLDLSAIKTGMKQIAPGGEYPEALLVFNEAAQTVGKRGVKFVATYEAIREMPIPLFKLAIKEIALKSRRDQVGELVGTIFAAGTSATKNSFNTGDTNGTGTIQYKTHLKFTAMDEGYKFTKILGDIDMIIAVLLMQKPSVDPIQLMNFFSDRKRAIIGEDIKVQNSQWNGTELIVHPDCPATTLAAIDPKFAAVQVTTAGVKLTEAEKIMSRQLEALYVTLADAFYIRSNAAIRKMTNI